MSNEISTTKRQLPTLEELNGDIERAFKNDGLNQLLSTQPPQAWIKSHPFVKVEVVSEQYGKQKVPLLYIPVEKVKFLLTRIFQRWASEIVSVQQLFNAVVVVVRLKVLDPVSGDWICNDGVGAVGVQTDAGSAASDMVSIKADAVMKAAPAAESYALKNAAEKFGKIFGGELMKDMPPFAPTYQQTSYEDLSELYELKKEALTAEEIADAERIINNQEKVSYTKLKNMLSSK